jgi:creatinine deaminase
MLEVALWEARSGLAEGGIPIGAALSPLMASCWAVGGTDASRSEIPRFTARPTASDEAAGAAAKRDTVMVTTLWHEDIGEH